VAKMTVKIGSAFDKRGVDDAKKGVKGLTDEVKSGSSTMSGMAGLAGVAAAAYGVVKALQAAAKTAKEFVDAYAEQESVERRLEAAARNNPLINGEAVASLKEYASALQSTSIYGDEAIIQQQQFLVALGMNEQQIRSVLKAAVNLASTGMVSLESATRNIAKTFGGLTGELGELIPGLKDLTKEELESGKAVEYLNKQFGGMAESMRDTTTGTMKAFENAWGDLKEVMGGFISSVVVPFITKLTTIVELLTEVLDKTATFKKRMSGGDLKLVDLRLMTAEEIAAAVAQGAASGGRFGSPFGGMEGPETSQPETSTGTAIWDIAKKYESLLVTPQQKIAEALKIIRPEIEQIRNNFRALQKDQSVWIGGYQQEMQTILDFLLEQEHILETQLLTLRKQADYTKGVGAFKTGTPPAAIPSQWSPEMMAGYMFPINYPTSRAAYGSDIGAAALTGAFGGTEVGAIAGGGGAAAMLAGAFQTLTEQVASFSLVLNPLQVIFKALGKVVGPLIDKALAPLIGMLVTLGEFIGGILTPIFKVLEPVLLKVAEGFVWFYNNVLRHVGNAIITLINTVIRTVGGIVNLVIMAVNKIIGWFGGEKIPRWDFEEVLGTELEKISLQDLLDKGKTEIDSAGGPGLAGSNTTVMRMPDIYFTQNIYGTVAGDGGAQTVGDWVNEALTAFVQSGGQITFAEAG